MEDVQDVEAECYEIYLADDDLEKHYDAMVEIFTRKSFNGNELIVHAPHAFSPETPERLIDLSSPVSATRAKSIETIRQALELSSALSARYLVIHPGGISKHPIDSKGQLYRGLLSSLQELGSKRLLLENMPWFYWIGDERYTSNILIFAEEFEDLLPHCGGICLDLCHAYLSQEQGSPRTILEFFRRYPEHIKHLHVSDAVSPDGEGLQIGAGVVDLPGLFNDIYEVVDARARSDENKIPNPYCYTMIPEIKGGHLQGNAVSKEGFRRLRDLISTSAWTLDK